MIEQWRELIETAARRNGLDPSLLAAIVQVESGGDPDAARYERFVDATSIGLMQIMTFPYRNLSPGLLLDPAYNLNYGARLFASVLKNADGDTRLALALYNCGAEGVRRNLCGKYGGYRYADKVLETCHEFGGCDAPRVGGHFVY